MNSLKLALSGVARWFKRLLNQIGGHKQCYVCGKQFRFFRKYGKGSGGGSEFRRRLEIVGSDLDNFSCMFCGAHDRERHLFMYFDELCLWERLSGAKVMHFAPEQHLGKKIEYLTPKEYIQADLYPKNNRIKAIDATRIPYADESFDVVIANHVLEHIPDYFEAIREFYRILVPGGIAILQTPYSRFLKLNFEDENINTDDGRLFFHGQGDHVRTFGEFQFLEDIKKAGFDLQLVRHVELFDHNASTRYGVNPDEDLIRAVKPDNASWMS